MKKLVLPLLSAMCILGLSSCENCNQKADQKVENVKSVNRCETRDECQEEPSCGECQEEPSCGCCGPKIEKTSTSNGGCQSGKCSQKANGKFYPYSNGDESKTSPASKERQRRRW